MRSHRWVRGELAVEYPDHVERKRSAYGELCNLRKYGFPVVGDREVSSITLADFDQVKAEIATRAAPRKVARATRRQIPQAMRRVMQLAEYPAKLIERNPIPTSAVPKGKTEVAPILLPGRGHALARRQARSSPSRRLPAIGKARDAERSSVERPSWSTTRSTMAKLSATRHRSRGAASTSDVARSFPIETRRATSR